MLQSFDAAAHQLSWRAATEAILLARRVTRVYSEDTLLRLVGLIYDAALAPERWPTFLESLAEVVDGHLVNLAHSDPRGDQITIGATARFDPAALRLYSEYYGACDPWAKGAAARGLIRTGGLGLGSWVVSASAYHKTEFYNDFGRRFGLSGGFSVILRMEDDVAAALSVMQRGREFGDSEIEIARGLLPHLQRALQIHDRLAGLACQRAGEDVIDRLPFGVMFVDAVGGVVFLNRAAQQAVETGDGLRLCNKRLVASNAEQTTRLRALVAAAIAAGIGGGLSPGGAIPITRPSAKRPLQVLVTPIHAAGASLNFSSVTACAAIFVSDPELQPLPDEAILRLFFGLTPAETRFAIHLLQQKSVKETADFLQISLNTARTHLKKLLEKTGTRRQSELVRLLAGGLGQLRH